MADLRIISPKLTEDFARACADRGFPLPWTFDGVELVAADGTVAAEVDPDGLEAAEEGKLPIGDLILIAVNTCGGFKAVLGT